MTRQIIIDVQSYVSIVSDTREGCATSTVHELIPFKIAVADGELDDLRRRLQSAR